MALYVSGSSTQFGGALDGNRFDNNNLINYFTTLFRNYCRGLSTREIKIAIIVNSRTVRLSSGRGDINRSRVPYRGGQRYEQAHRSFQCTPATVTGSVCERESAKRRSSLVAEFRKKRITKKYDARYHRCTYHNTAFTWNRMCFGLAPADPPVPRTRAHTHTHTNPS